MIALNTFFIESDVLKEIRGVRHFFSTRKGGVSPAPFESLNLGMNTSDCAQNVEKNFDILCNSTGLERSGVLWARQTHGCGFLTIGEGDDLRKVYSSQADALITARKGVCIGVKTADCCPILIADKNARLVAAVHSGWLGTSKRILEKVITVMNRSFGVGPDDLKMAIGPSIGACCYRISRSRYDSMKENLPFMEEYAEKSKDTYFIDLKGLNSRIARQNGIRDEAIWVSGHCTSCAQDLFYSFRRDGEKTGRHYSGIMLKP